jgi:tRNA (guanine10-N2)-dimethyltransferase
LTVGPTVSALTYVFRISGENSSLPKRELLALLEVYGEKSCIVKQLHEDVFLVEGRVDIREILGRAAFVKSAGQVVGFVDLNMQRILNFGDWMFDSNQTFAVRFMSSRTENTPGKDSLVSFVGDYVRRKTGCHVDLKNPEQVLHVLPISKGEGLLLFSDIPEQRRRWVDRRPRSRRFFHPSAIFPKLARCLVNLTRLRRGETFLDPFCGTGSLLIEAGIIGLNAFGSDISRRMVYGSIANLKKFGIKHEEVFLSDIGAFPLTSIDGIASDLPYGRCSRTFGREKSLIQGQFVDVVKQTLAPGRFAVVMNSSGNPPLSYGRELEVLSEDAIYVHRSLTRLVTVIKRR